VADYDLAMACWLLARVLEGAGAPEQALPLLDEAQKRFETIARETPDRSAERMASVCLTERGDCLRALGRLDWAVAAYEESIRRAEKVGDARQAAVGKGQLGTVRREQRRYKEALAANEEARELFTRLDEPGTVAVSWHQTGIVYEMAKQPEAAEDAYRKSLAIKVRLGDLAGQASTLAQLGNLYTYAIGRLEEAVAFYRQAAEKYVEIRDAASEGAVRNNVAETLRRIRLLTKPGWKSSGPSSVKRSSAMGPGRGRLGPSLRTSRPTLETLPPPGRRRAEPWHPTWLTGATEARITTSTGASAWT
jgi:tetratricopeptide (TPR) repeat protein